MPILLTRKGRYLILAGVTMQNETNSVSASSREEDFLLSLAAMFKGEFSLDWLEELARMKASRILSLLEQEVQSGLLTRIKPAVYVFKNSKQREEQFNHLSLEEKERYHRTMSTIFIRDLHDDDSKALEIAEYLLCISNDLNECQWLIRAGEIYAQLLRTDKAIACFTHVLTQLSNQRGESEDRIFIKAAIGYSNVYGGRVNMEQCLSFLHEASERAKYLHNQSYELLLEMHIAKYERLGSQLNRAMERFEQAFSQVERLDDPELTASITIFHTYFLFWQGRYREVVNVYEKSVPDVERYPIGGHFPVIAATMVGHCYAMVGQITQGLGLLDAIRNYCYQKEDLYLAAHADSAIAMVMLSINRAEDTLRYLKLSLKEAEESNNHWVGNLVILKLALVHHHMGSNKESLHYLRRFLRNNSGPQANLLLYPYLMELCWAIESGKLPAVPGLSLENEIDRMLNIRNIFMQGIAYRYKALLGKSRGSANQEITRLFTLSAKLLNESGNQIELAKTYLELTRHYLSTGNEKKGKATMQVASAILSSTNIGLIPDDLKTLIQDQNLEGTILIEIMNLTDEMGSKKDSSKLLQHIVSTVNRITGAERGALLLLDEERTPPKLKLRASKNLTIEQIYDPAFASSRKMIEEVIHSGKGCIFEIGSSEDTTPELQMKERVRSSICVPLLLSRKAIGVLYHENRLLGNVFKEYDLKLLAFFAALATLDLNGEKAYQEIDRLLREEKQENSFYRKERAEPRQYEGIIGTSPAIQQIMTQISRVAKTDTAVLILGETGVGKNLLAEAIHRQSLRADGPFITVQCSALTESLITSELFGHEKGAFTGATNRYVGRFEMAHKGTLFLDEIGDLSLEVQARLLRVLQSKEFERVGGGKDVLVSDFRLIAATNRNLEQEVQAGRFREDLYYRINVIPLLIPPLRERKEDIPLLVHHFLSLNNAKQGTNIVKIKQETMDALMRHNWSGNIRELENVIQRGLIVGTGSYFQLPSLKTAEPNIIENNKFKTLKEQERAHILQALQQSRWKINGPGGAAQILDINASTLAFRMKKLGIKKPTIYTG
jgi:formate hydrogenlyase transcriptional activator